MIRSAPPATPYSALQQVNQSLKVVLNHLDAVVYVADMSSYEILFINDKLHCQHGDVVGKKCYAVFQQRSAPCPFCTNARLLGADGMPTGVYQWEHWNPVTGRWYELRDQAIPWIDGRSVRLEIGFDITEKKLREEELGLHGRLLDSLLYAAEQFLHCRNWTAVIQAVLEDLGRRTGASTVCLFQLRTDEAGRSALHKSAGWTAGPTDPAGPATTIELHRFPALARIFAGQEVQRMDVADLPSAEQDSFHQQAIQSFCVAPVIIEKTVWGWLCFAAPTRRDWSGAEVDALRVATGILGGAVRRQGIEAELNLARLELEAKVEQRTRELRRSRDRLNLEMLEREKTTEALASRSRELEEVNIALKVLLEQSSAARTELEKRMEANLRKLVLPYLDTLDLLLPEGRTKEYTAIVRENLQQITSSFSINIGKAGSGMSSREIQIADFIKQGKTSKEIAELTGLSPRTVETYRNRIRRKLGIRNKKVNLQSHLADLG